MIKFNPLSILLLPVLYLTVLLTINGCSISESAGSLSRSSESVSDSSKSSSESSGTESKQPEENTYEQGIQDFTVTFLRTNPVPIDQQSFMKGVSDVASENSVVDWEANPKTYRGIGKGLRKAKISGDLYRLYLKTLSNGDAGKMDDIQEGYNASR